MNSGDIKNLGLLGGGLMGAGIAQSAMLAGFPVTLYDLSDEALSDTKYQIESGPYGLDRGVACRKFTYTEAEQARKRLTCSTDMSDLASSDLIIESIPEKLELKRVAFAEVERVVRGDTILASNTSGFPICEIAENLKDRSRMIGLHWFAPANIMTGIELIHHPDVRSDVIDRVRLFCDRLGKVAYLVKDKKSSYGFVCNRVHLAMVKEALKVVEEGLVSTGDLNDLFKRCYGWPAGPTEKGYPMSKEGVLEVTRLRAERAGW